LGLQGTLATFTLADVLRLLAATRKTGCLYIDGDRGRGSIWLQQGQLIEATVDSRGSEAWPLVELLFELLRFERGSFKFASVDHSEVRDAHPLDLESTLRSAMQLLVEWRELSAVVPSLIHRVALAPQLKGDRVVLDAIRWRAIGTIADGPAVAEVAARLELSELEVTRRICDLVDLGVAVVEPPDVPHGPLGAVSHAPSAHAGVHRHFGGTPDPNAALHPVVPASQ